MLAKLFGCNSVGIEYVDLTSTSLRVLNNIRLTLPTKPKAALLLLILLVIVASAGVFDSTSYNKSFLLFLGPFKRNYFFEKVR